jgi:Spy/CpxP family protein refolding chaperone
MVRKSALGAVIAAAILAGGLWAGRIAAGPIGHGRHFSAERVFGRIADKLDLSETQRTQVKDVLRSHKDAIAADIKSVHDARSGLHAAIEASPMDENAIRARAAQLGRAEGDAAILRAQIRAEILPILNDDQKENLAAFRSRVEGSGDRFAASVQEFLAK